MPKKAPQFTKTQLTFQELFIGALIYVTVLGFFNDYSSIVEIKSFTSLFFAALVLETLTYLTFRLKGRIVRWLGGRSGLIYRIALIFCVWLVMFISKFVFIWALDLIFDDYVNINGFFGILILVLCVTIAQKTAYLLFRKLGSQEPTN